MGIYQGERERFLSFLRTIIKKLTNAYEKSAGACCVTQTPSLDSTVHIGVRHPCIYCSAKRTSLLFQIRRRHRQILLDESDCLMSLERGCTSVAQPISVTPTSGQGWPFNLNNYTNDIFVLAVTQPINSVSDCIGLMV